MNTLLDYRYELLKIEGKIEYYLNTYSKAYRTAKMKYSRDPSPNNLWKKTYEVLETVITRLGLVKKEVSKARLSPIPYQVSGAIRTLEELRVFVDAHACYPNIKKSISVSISDLESDLWHIIRSSGSTQGF